MAPTPGQPSPEPEPLLAVRGLHKRYAAPVLAGVDLDLYAGEAHALVGANGAGKSTLSRIVAGLARADAGTLRLAGAPFAPRAKADAERAGVQLVRQELNLVGTLSVAENLFLNRLPRRLGVVARGRLRADARRALAAVGLDDLDPDAPAGRLGVGQQQLVEIAAALARPCRLLVLDEPTAALTAPEVERLFAHVARLKRDGVAVLYVSHRMDEIRRVCERTTVLRDGRVVATRPTAALPADEAVRLMVGRAVAPAAPAGPPNGAARPVALRVERLTRGDRVRGVSFEVRRGEVLGLAGLVGSGRTETLRAIFGADRAESGRVSVAGDGGEPRPVRVRAPRDAVRAGIGLVPEDRKAHGLLLAQSVRVNCTLGAVRRAAAPGGWAGRLVPGWLDPRRERAAAERACAALAVACASVEQPAAELSGGNQQKVVIARWLGRDCAVLLLDEPTRGVDAAAKAAVHALLADLARAGTALVVASSELEELTAVCDRIAVLSAGRVAAVFDRGAWSDDQIMAAAFSGYRDAPSSPAF